METNNQIWEQKDKRISFLSILHSLAILHQGQNMDDAKLADFATKLNDTLYQKYPFPTDMAKTTPFTPKATTAPLNASGNDIKACPKCGKPMNRQFNKKTEKSPDWKCSDNKCKFNFQNGQWVASQYITSAWNDNPKDVARANYQDSVDDESHKQHYQNEHPDQQYGEFGEPI